MERVRATIQTERAQQAARWVVLPVLVYAVVAVLLTWPLARGLSTEAPGLGHTDTYMMLRQAWAAREAVLDGHNPLEQTLLVYPDGFTSRMQWSNPLRWVPTMLLMFVFAPLTAFNVWLLATLVLNGLTAYWLGMELTGRHIPAALLGGLAFTAFPNMQGHLAVGHLDVLSMYGLPLVALCTWRVLARGAGWRTVAWGGVWFMLASLGLTSQIIYNVLPVIGFLGLFFVLVARDQLSNRAAVWHAQPWVRTLALVVWGGVLLLPFFGPLLTSAGQDEIQALRETGRVSFSADVLATVSPSPFGPLADWGFAPDYARDVLAVNSAEGAAYLGVVGLALTILALTVRVRAQRRTAMAWLAVAVGAVVLSWGPLLKWRDQPFVWRVEELETYVTLPWAVLQDLPVLDATRTPGRFNGAVALAVAALVALGARRLLDGVFALVGRGRVANTLRLAVTLLLGAVIFVEYLLFWPFPTGASDQGPYFVQLARADDVRAVLNLPADHTLAVMQSLYQQTIHGKPMLAGQLYRRTPQDPAKLAILQRAALGGLSDGLPPIAPEAARYLLHEAGADRVIVHKRFVPDEDVALAHLRNVLGAPEYEDARIAAFVVPESTLPSSDAALFAAGNGWSEPVQLDDLRARYMGAEATWYLYVPDDRATELSFDAAALGLPRRVGIWLDGRLVAAQWVGMEDRLTLPVWIAPGYHSLRLVALDGCDPYRFPVARPDGDSIPLGTAGDPACLSVAVGSPDWRALDAQPAALDLQFGAGLNLRGYTLTMSGGEDGEPRGVRVRLFWQASGSFPANMALFVHVADPLTGEPRAQQTDQPLIATDTWDDGAVWSSDVWVALDDDVPAGDYALNVGWFDPLDNTQLSVEGGDHWAQEGIAQIGMVVVP